MNLCAPTIVGPLSELSKSIRVQGQLAGSTVTISSIGPNPRTVAKKSSLPSSDERIGLLSGVTLNQKDLLIAVQALGGQTSSPTAAALATPIQPAPKSAGQIGHVGYETHLYEFDQNGKFLRLIGEGLYGFAFAHAVRIDPHDNIWAVDEGANMIIKFNPEGQVLMLMGRKPETHQVEASAPQGTRPPPAQRICFLRLLARRSNCPTPCNRWS